MPRQAKSVFHVGIDFGATYSGVAVVCTRLGSLRTIFDGFKQPTESYCPTAQPLCKLLLADVDEWNKTSSDPNALAELNNAEQKIPLGSMITASTAVVIRDLWSAALAQMLQSQDWSMPGQKEVHAVFAYPAVWQGKSVKGRFQEAVYQAGVYSFNGGTTVHFVTESEAAAEALLFEEEGLHLDSTKETNNIIVADCGSVTTDTAAFRVHQQSGAVLQDFASRLWGVLSIDLAFKNCLENAIASPDLHETKEKVESILKEWRTEDIEIGSRNVYAGSHFRTVCRGTSVSIFRDDMIKCWSRHASQVALAIYSHYESLGSTPDKIFLIGGISSNLLFRVLVQEELGKLEGNADEIRIEGVAGFDPYRNLVALGAALSGSAPRLSRRK